MEILLVRRLTFFTLISIVDTGINAAHTDFGGRASLGYSAVSGTTDDVGHGTHVAGTVAGRTYGVAKSATVIAVKVFTGDEGTTADVLDGFDWAVNDIISKGRQNVAAISMSLGEFFPLVLSSSHPPPRSQDAPHKCVALPY